MSNNFKAGDLVKIILAYDYASVYMFHGYGIFLEKEKMPSWSTHGKVKYYCVFSFASGQEMFVSEYELENV